MQRPCGLILAGGKSRRMGQDKALLPLGGAPLVAHVIARLTPQVNHLAIAANDGPNRFLPWQGPILADHFPDAGPLAALHAGLIWAEQQGASHLLAAPCDMPFLPHTLSERLTAHDFAIATDGQHSFPTLGLWPVHLLPHLEASLGAGRRRLRDLTRAFGAIEVPFDAATLANLNTPEDYARAVAQWR